MQDNLLSPLELLKEFCISNYIKRDAESAIACLSKDIHWFGISDKGDAYNIREAADYIIDEIFRAPSSYRIEFLDENENVLSDGLGTASVKIKIISGGLSVLSRVTAVVKLEDGENRIGEMHTSVSGMNQQNGEYFPYKFAEAQTGGWSYQGAGETREAEEHAAERKAPELTFGYVPAYAAKSFWKERHGTILVLAVVLALIIAVVCFAAYLTKTQWKATASTIKTASLAGIECVSSAIEADRLILSDIAQLVGKSDSQDTAELLDGVQTETTFREIIAVFDNGTRYSSIGSSPEEIAHSLEQLEYCDGEDVSRSYYGNTGRKQVTYRRDIVTDGEKTGVVYGVVDLSKYYAPSVMEFYEGKGFSYVIDVQSGDFLIYTTRTMSQGAYRDFYTVLQESESEEEIQELKKVLMSGKAGSTIIDLLGTRTYLYFVPLSSGSSRYLITMVPYETMRAESSGLVYIVVSFIVAVILAAVMVLVLNERMARTKAKERGYREMLFHLLSENVDSVFFIYDSHTHRLDYVSENTRRILGVERKAFMGENFLKTNLMPEPDRLEQIKRLCGRKCNFSMEYAYHNPLTGEQQLLRLSGYIPNEKAWQNKWIFCVDDRTEDVLKERRLEQAVQEAEDANYAKTEFLANMSHDIRTPMNGIIGMTQLALMEGVDAVKMRGYMERIEGSTAFLLSLINDILDMSKIESGNVELNYETYSIRRLRVYLESVIQPLCREKDIMFEAEVADNLCFLADQKRLDQILFNLLSNAVKYTKNNGKVVFSMRIQEKKGDKLHLLIGVRDNGIGMTPEFQKKMFQPFAQEERKIAGMNGTGLGLAIVKNLVDLMGGSIRVESDIGKGTSFWVELDVPESERPEEKEDLKENDTGSKRPKNIHILLCEDNAMNREIMVDIMETMEILTDVAIDGKQGVELYLKHEPGYYKAVLMDCRMPVMDGYEATRMIRGAGRTDSGRIPIIALTADAFEEDKKRCMEAGMSEFLTKPIDIRKLEKVLNHSIQEGDSV